jgi:hypothetical protein
MPKSNTTQPGVSDEAETDDTAVNGDLLDGQDVTTTPVEDTTPEPELDARSQIIANARKKRDEEKGEPLQVYGKDGSEEDEPEPEPEPEPEMVTVKVDGVEQQVLKTTVDEAGGISAYQKEQAASRRIAEAGKLKKQAEDQARILAQREADIAKREQLISQREKQIQSQPPKTDAGQTAGFVDVDLTDDELAEMLYSGDEKEAAKAIRIMRGRKETATPAFNPQELIAQASQQARWDIEQQQAIADFTREYDDINADPILREYANEMTKVLLKEHPEYGPRRIIMESGERTRERFFRDSPSPKQDTSDNDERMKNKRAMDNVKAANATVPKKPEQKPLTKSEIVANIIEQRNQR